MIVNAGKPSTRRPAIQLQIKTILNRIQHYGGFVYQDIRFGEEEGSPGGIEIRLEAHRGMRGRCSQCRRPAPGYDRLKERRWGHVPLWGIKTWFLYVPRRVECAEHGVVVEYLPWNEGKRSLTTVMMGFLARWGRRLSWRETAEVFQTSWEAVYRSVEWLVQWGLAHRELQGVRSLGVDEIHWGHGLGANNFLTVLYQIDAHCRRLLWVGKGRSRRTLRRGLTALGTGVVQGVRFVCSDMWKPYLEEIGAQVGHALHVLDRFHITMHLNQAVDQVRRGEGARLRAAGQSAAQQQLKHMRWPLLRRGSRVRGRARQKLKAERSVGQQASDGPGVEAERNLRSFLELPIRPLGRGFSSCLVRPSDAQPSGADEERGPGAARPRTPVAELVPGQRRDFRWRR